MLWLLVRLSKRSSSTRLRRWGSPTARWSGQSIYSALSHAAKDLVLAVLFCGHWRQVEKTLFVQMTRLCLPSIDRHYDLAVYAKRSNRKITDHKRNRGRG